MPILSIEERERVCPFLQNLHTNYSYKWFPPLLQVMDQRWRRILAGCLSCWSSSSSSFTPSINLTTRSLLLHTNMCVQMDNVSLNRLYVLYIYAIYNKWCGWCKWCADAGDDALISIGSNGISTWSIVVYHPFDAVSYATIYPWSDHRTPTTYRMIIFQ